MAPRKRLRLKSWLSGTLSRSGWATRRLLMLLQEELPCEAILLVVHLPGEKVAFIHTDFTLN